MEYDYYVPLRRDLGPFYVCRRLGKVIKAHLTKHRGPYGFIFLLWAFLLWYSSNLYSGPMLCMMKFLDVPELGYLSNVTLYPEHAFKSAPGNSSISVYADVSDNILHITSGDYGTKLEIQKWDGKGTTGGLYAEIPGETLCGIAGCPPVTSSGDFIGSGIPTIRRGVLPSKVVIMYTIFLVPTLEERARERIFYNGAHFKEVKTLWDTVILHGCLRFITVLAAAWIGIYVFAYREDVTFLCICAPSRSPTVHQDPQQGRTPGSVNGQHQGVGRTTNTSDGPDVAVDPGSPPRQHSTDADTSRLRRVPDDLGSNNSLVSAKSEKGRSGTAHTTLVSTTSSRSSSDEHWTNDSSSDDDSNPPSNVQEETTTDVPPPHYARHRPHAVYETPAGGTGVPRPTPQGSGCGM